MPPRRGSKDHHILCPACLADGLLVFVTNSRRAARRMPTVEETLAIGLAHHQAGRLRQAEPIYRQILALDPRSAQAWHLLGAVAYGLGQHEQAIEYSGRALELNPNYVEAHYNRGNALKDL